MNNIDSILEELKNRTRALEAHVAYRNGINFSGPIQSNDFAAMTATAIGAGEAALDLRNQGTPTMVVVHGCHSILIIMPAGPKALISLLVNKNFMDDEESMPLIAMKVAAEKIADIVK